MPSAAINKQLDDYAAALDVVMRRLNQSLLDVVGGATTATQLFDSSVLLNSQPAMLEALRDSGYFALAEEHVATFSELLPANVNAYTIRGFNVPEFSTIDRQDFRALAQMDLDKFNNIGVSAMNELRATLVSNAVSSVPFSTMVQAVAAATIGIDGKGSPLRNSAYTQANTAVLEFNGQVSIRAGESIGFDSDDDLWEIEGPLDGVTRDVCQNALANPVRTRKQWQDADYWGGAPGGYNCRHVWYPFFDEEVQLLG